MFKRVHLRRTCNARTGMHWSISNGGVEVRSLSINARHDVSQDHCKLGMKRGGPFEPPHLIFARRSDPYASSSRSNPPCTIRLPSNGIFISAMRGSCMIFGQPASRVALSGQVIQENTTVSSAFA